MNGKEKETIQPRGFTLIEMTVVLFLVALVIGLSSIFMVDRMQPAANLDAAAREMSATLRRARVLAMMNGEEQKVTVDFDARDCGLEGLGSWKIPPGIGVAVLDPLYGEVRNGRYEIRFAANGGSEGADLIFWDKKRTISVKVDPILGAVNIRK